MSRTLPLIPKQYYSDEEDIFAQVYLSSSGTSDDGSSDGYVSDKTEPETNVALNERKNDSDIDMIDQQITVENAPPKKSSDSPKKRSATSEDSSQTLPLKTLLKIKAQKKIRRLKRRTIHSPADVENRKSQRSYLKRKLSSEREDATRKLSKQTSLDINFQTQSESSTSAFGLECDGHNVPGTEDSKENEAVLIKEQSSVAKNSSKCIDNKSSFDYQKELKEADMNVSSPCKRTSDSNDDFDQVKRYSLPESRPTPDLWFGRPLPSKRMSTGKIFKRPFRKRKKRKISTGDFNKENSIQPPRRKKLKNDQSQVNNENCSDLADDEFDDDDEQKSLRRFREEPAEVLQYLQSSSLTIKSEKDSNVLCSEGASTSTSVENLKEPPSPKEKFASDECDPEETCRDCPDYSEKIATLREMLAEVLPVPKTPKRKKSHNSKKPRKPRIRNSEAEKSSPLSYSGEGNFTNPSGSDIRKDTNTEHSDAPISKGKKRRKKKKAYLLFRKRDHYRRKREKDLRRKYLKNNRRLHNKNAHKLKSNSNRRRRVLQNYLKMFSNPKNPWKEQVTTWIKSALGVEEVEEEEGKQEKGENGINLSDMNPEEYFVVDNVDDAMDVAAVTSVENKEQIGAEVQEEQPTEMKSSSSESYSKSSSQESSDSTSSSYGSSFSNSSENESVDNKSPENESMNNKSPENESMDNKSPENESMDNKSPENESMDNKSPENESVDNKSPENESVDKKSSDNESSDFKSPSSESSES